MKKFISLTRYACKDTLRQNLTLSLAVMYAVLLTLYIFIIRISVINGSIGTISIAGGTPMTPGEFIYVIPELPRIIIAVLFILTVVLSAIVATHLLTDNFTPGMMSFLLARPVSRTVLLTGTVFGIITGICIIQTVFMLFCWLIFSFKSAAFDLSLLWACLPMCIAFAGMFSMIVFFSTVMKKTVLTTGLVLAYGLYGTDLLTKLAHSDTHSLFIRIIIRPLYFLMPPIADLKTLAGDFLLTTHADIFPMFLGLFSAGFFLSATILIFRRIDF